MNLNKKLLKQLFQDDEEALKVINDLRTGDYSDLISYLQEDEILIGIFNEAIKYHFRTEWLDD